MFERLCPISVNGLLCIDAYHAARRLADAVVTRYINAVPFAEHVAWGVFHLELAKFNVHFTSNSCVQYDTGVFSPRVCVHTFYGEEWFYV